MTCRIKYIRGIYGERAAKSFSILVALVEPYRRTLAPTVREIWRSSSAKQR